jgi:23S rRNA (cytidine1920-2'-O)/16S rRNA (cytidine1409-2'-O)-methyltransferase
MEGVNFRHFLTDTANRSKLKETPEFVTIDVSFISLDKILPQAAQILCANGEIVALVKPQFEAAHNETKKGVVKDEQVRTKTIEKTKRLAELLNLKIKGGMDCPIKGPQGNVEYLLWLGK